MGHRGRPEFVKVARKALGSPSQISDVPTNSDVRGRISNEFSSDGKHLITNCGLFSIGARGDGKATSEVNSPYILHVSDQWILYDRKRILRLPAGFDIVQFDVKGDRLAVALTNGRVLAFTIDRKRVNSGT